MRHHETTRNQLGMDPLASERAQYGAYCLGQAMIASARAKVSLMILAGYPSPPVIAPVPHQHHAHNQRDVANFRDVLLRIPPFPLSPFDPPLDLSLRSPGSPSPIDWPNG